MNKSKNPTAMKLSPEAFKKVWDRHEFFADVAKETGYTVGGAANRAKILRARGMDLKKLPRSRMDKKLINWEPLIAFALTFPGAKDAFRRTPMRKGKRRHK